MMLSHSSLRWSVSFALVAVLAGCGVSATKSTTSTTIVKTAIPLGDGKRSSTTPAVGSIYTCTASFSGTSPSTGPWINYTNSTWDETSKVAVSGSVSWPANYYNMAMSGSTRVVTSVGLPNHTTGTYPIAKTDAAYTYDKNPNSIGIQSYTLNLPQTPTAAANPTCLPMGGIGVMLSGVALYNGLDGGGNDAVAHELQDSCNGHPDQSSVYHYHNVSGCLSDPGTGHSALLGYALDGFGIYGPRGESGETLTNADLDECHGHTHSITWDGQTVTMYHYHATTEYPYTVGCFHGTPINVVIAKMFVPRLIVQPPGIGPADQTQMNVALAKDGKLWLDLRDRTKPGRLVASHGYPMHLFAVRMPNMDAVLHLHPKQISEGVFIVDLPDARSGEYRLFADIEHAGASSETLTANLHLPTMSGGQPKGDDTSGQPSAIYASMQRPATEQMPDGYKMQTAITLSGEKNGATRLVAGKEADLAVTLLNTKGAAPSDMADYLQMRGHAAIVRSDGKSFAHIHPIMTAAMPDMPNCPMAKNADNAPNRVHFRYSFPSAGKYRVFVQMKHGSRVEMGAFDVVVHA